MRDPWIVAKSTAKSGGSVTYANSCVKQKFIPYQYFSCAKAEVASPPYDQGGDTFTAT
jgi:hypothetical protein